MLSLVSTTYFDFDFADDSVKLFHKPVQMVKK